MLTDVNGRVKNMSLASSKPLLPLYEAVVNSVQAIQDAEEQQGRIEIGILRDDMHVFNPHEPSFGEIVGFEVIDNGIGFNEENFKAFETSDTTYKAQRGGRGIGRFLWLVAFERVEVVSHFTLDGKMFCRNFKFGVEEEGVSNMMTTDSKESKHSTNVRLNGFKAKYQKQCPKKIETIATHLIEHCLEYFIRSDCPEIILIDRSSGESLNLNDRFEHEITAQSQRSRVLIEGHDFYVLHVRLYSSHVKDHQLHFCADSRVVRSEKLHGHLPNLSRRIQDEDGRDFVYAAYVDSAILDDLKNSERTDFEIVEDDTDLLTKTITWRAIRTAVFESCNNFLKPYTGPILERKRKRIENFVSNDGPMYRPILKYVENRIDLIDPEINDDKLDLELYKAYHDLQVELRIQGIKFLQQDIKDEEWEEFNRKFQDYFDKISDINKSDLARYVCHRRAILDFLQKQLGPTSDGKYRREERIHKIIFPLRKTSDDVPFDEHNLWVLNEELVYHAFLASDKSLRTNPEIITQSRKEPDLLVFDKACAFTASGDLPYAAITIVEFKRPMRDDYKPDDNPFIQVRQYLEDIRDGKARTFDGRDIPVGKDIPFFCYIVSDITPTLEQQAYDFELTKTPDNQGFFGYKKRYNAYVEVISYTKMVASAKKRNAALFDKLALPVRIGQ
ncbi:MAG: hypothetical protein ILNGONEN_01040 [Syntrophorhabdaceae bacterium]|nr:hypothetical protein [Syntrophorhabdaceae bacterium]